MINMIKAEAYRTSKNMGIYIAALLMLLLIVPTIYLVSPGNIGINVRSSAVENTMGDMNMTQLQSLSIGEVRELMLQQDSYKLDQDVLAHNINLYYIFIFVAAIMITIDFTSGSVKNTLTSAISKKKYFWAKSLSVTILCLVFLFIHNYLMYFSNVIFNGKNLSSGLGPVTKITLLQLPPVLALISILVGMAFTTRKTALYNCIAIPFFSIWQMVFNGACAIFKIPKEIASYDLSMMFPLLASDPTGKYITVSYAVCAGIMVLFLSIGYWSFKKTEIR